MTKEKRKIKKYGNRRLYDTGESCYITIRQVRDMLMAGVEFQVVDAKSGEDITRSVLLQIMADEEAAGEPLFSANMLTQIIRFYGSSQHGLFAQYMEQSLEQFATLQERFGQTMAEPDPLSTINKVVEGNIKLMSDMQEQLLRAAGFASTKTEDK